MKQKRKILIIEDEGDTSEKLQRAVANINLVVHTAYSYKEALKKVNRKDSNYALIIMDLYLPINTGDKTVYADLGIKLVDKVFENHPKTKFIAVTKNEDVAAIKNITQRFSLIYTKSLLHGDILKDFVDNVNSLVRHGKILENLPKIFIGSSSEALSIATAIKDNLAPDADCTIWKHDSVIGLSTYTLPELHRFIKEVKYAIFVYKPDDTSKIRNIKHQVARDNVIFETGLAMGLLDIEQVFILIPNNSTKFHIPSDFAGFTSGTYNANCKAKDLSSEILPFCNKIRIKLKK